MIISHKYKFIFIKTVKTAGTSIEVFLSGCCGDNDIFTPIIPHVKPHRARNYKGLWNPLPELLNTKDQSVSRSVRNLYATARAILGRDKFYNHIRASVVRNRVPEDIWNSYFKFCVERNPWDKTLSHYHMLNYRSGGNLSFNDYMLRGKFCTDFPKYTDTHGNLLVDKVVQYESLQSELSDVFSELGIPFYGSLGVNAKSEYRTDRRPYQEVFSDTHRQIIEAAFSSEIKMHGYTF
ncbi:MAG: hypothetical protein LAT77_10540 [Aliidiomarina sp.]|uniref:hypothetical protein n=1 Tax=Aliidiomarina sp. TaxID=1872439 RepID=UPI0025B8FE7A|nr:hypothetical protein [Aliidiomarina sp.]MCH8502332.1 hypothetical protein [Aliidiomarina sp.]